MPNYFPEEFIQEVTAANDIVDVIGDYVQLKRQGSGMVGLCPFHREKTPSFHVSPDKQFYHCFGCGLGGTVIKFVMEAENFDFVEAVKFLAERAGISVPETGGDRNNELYEKKQRIYQMNRLAARFFYNALHSKEAAEAQAYVKKRGLSAETVRTFGIGFAPDRWDGLIKHLESHGFHRGEMVEAGLAKESDKGRIYDFFRNRLMFPVFDVRGNVIAFGGRIMSGDSKGMKYINSPETPVFNKSRNLFSLNFAKKAGKDFLILAEGYMDVISLYQSGIQNAVAGLGTAFTSEQARILAKYTKNVKICYDSDEAGIAATKRAIEKFDGLDVKVEIIEIPQGKDPDEYIKKNSADSFGNLASSAKDTTQYQLSSMKKKYNLSDPQQKITFVNEAVTLFASLRNEVERDVQIRLLAEELGISSDSIYAEVRKRLRRDTRKKERETLREVVKETRSAEIKAKQNGIDYKLVDLERKILGLMFADRGIYQKFSEKLPVENYSLDIHKKIAQAIYTAWAEGVAPVAAEVLMGFSEEESGEVTAVLGASSQTGESRKAAEDVYFSLQEAWLDRKIQDAALSGDVSLLNELLKQKKQLTRKVGQSNE